MILLKMFRLNTCQVDVEVDSTLVVVDDNEDDDEENKLKKEINKQQVFK